MTAELFPPSRVSAAGSGRDSLGLRNALAGGHTARSMMLEELRALLSQTPAQASSRDIEEAVVANNILDKPTLSSRRKSLHHLRELYGLDVGQALFRVLRDFATRDPSSIPLLALTCAYCRDPQLRQSFELVDRLRIGEALPRQAMEASTLR